jgi:hypothetical protein
VEARDSQDDMHEEVVDSDKHVAVVAAGGNHHKVERRGYEGWSEIQRKKVRCGQCMKRLGRKLGRVSQCQNRDYYQKRNRDGAS